MVRSRSRSWMMRSQSRMMRPRRESPSLEVGILGTSDNGHPLWNIIICMVFSMRTNNLLTKNVGIVYLPFSGLPLEIS